MSQKKNTYKVSIIIPHYNGIDILSECLESLVKTITDEIEIIIVDNILVTIGIFNLPLSVF